MTTERKHKWAEVVKAWADGKPIQCRIGTQNEWIDWDPDQLRQSNASALFFPFDVPRFDQFEWRVKPEPVETYHFVEYMGEGDVEMYSSENLKANLRLTFEDKKLVKAEVIG